MSTHEEAIQAALNAYYGGGYIHAPFIVEAMNAAIAAYQAALSPTDTATAGRVEAARCYYCDAGMTEAELAQPDTLWVNDAYPCHEHCAETALTHPQPSNGDEVERLREAFDVLNKNVGFELTWGEVDGWPDDCRWRVHRRNGGRNDTEWELIATGDTAQEALLNARAARGEFSPETEASHD